MKIVEDFVDDYRIKKYGELADSLLTSQDFLTGRRSSDGIKIEELLVNANGDFSKYQELVRKRLSKYYNTDFLDFSLLMGNFFGVYNLYCYDFINQDIRYRLINNENISRQATLNFIKKNCRDIYNHLFMNFGIDEEEFIKITSSLFEVNNDNSLYNDAVVREIAYILMGNYLFLEEHSLKSAFIGSDWCVEYFKRENKNGTKRQVI